MKISYLQIQSYLYEYLQIYFGYSKKKGYVVLEIHSGFKQQQQQTSSRES